MGQYAQILTLSYDDALALKGSALKTNYYSVRLIKDDNIPGSQYDSYVTNILLNGKCIDPENRKLYLFYIDTFYNASWIIEIDVDTRVQNVVYYDPVNAIGFNPLYKIYNARIVGGKLIWTDGNSPIYQMDVARAKKSFYFNIGYNQNTNITEWVDDVYYYADQIISEGSYFYKCLIDNIGLNPTSWPAYWQQVCLIEECYYSMNVENFYFAPMPPTLAPIVEYQTDDTRKINNLRQTLFQFAYNYVYMDWRESTYSPASIVPMPNGEEEISTGYATEVISLNNVLKIRVNTGTEEVRKIKIIGRSSRDPSTWFLVDEIDKFSVFEKEYESSALIQTALNNITLTIPLPIGVLSGISLPDEVVMALSVPTTAAENSEIFATETVFGWAASVFGLAQQVPTTITNAVPVYQITITGIPAWLSVIETAGGTAIVNGMTFISGTEIAFFPASANGGAERTADITLTDNSPLNNTLTLSVTQSAPAAPVDTEVLIHPDDINSLDLLEGTGLNLLGSNVVRLDLIIDHPSYGTGASFILSYSISKNGSAVGSGTFTIYDSEFLSRDVTMSSVSSAGDEIIVLLWVEPLP